METDQSRQRQQQIRGAREEPQNRGAHSRARQQVCGSESTPTDRTGHQAMNFAVKMTLSFKRTFTRPTFLQVKRDECMTHTYKETIPNIEGLLGNTLCAFVHYKAIGKRQDYTMRNRHSVFAHSILNIYLNIYFMSTLTSDLLSIMQYNNCVCE